MKKLILLFLIINSFFSCKPEQEKKQKDIAKGLASPVYLNKGETKIVLRDYILQAAAVDSVGKSKYFDSWFSDDRKQLTVVPNKYFPAIQNLRLYVSGKTYDIPLFKNTKKKVQFNFPKTNSQKQVHFKSQIVGWQAVPMQDKGGYWTYKTALDSGNYQYLFVVDGKEVLDPNNPNKVSNGMGGFNSVLRIPDKSDKTPFLITDKNQGKSFTLTSKNSIEKAFVYVGNDLLSDQYVNIATNTHQITINVPQNHLEKTAIRVFAYNLFGRGNDVLIPIDKGEVIHSPKQLSRTDFHTQVMYFLMVDRFLDGDKSNTKKIENDSVLPKVNYMGGDLQGVIQKIDAGFFKDLGINTLWLSPITQNPDKAYGYWPDPVTKFSGYHGYWPVSNTKIDYRFGTDKTFKELLNKAHNNNCNVLLDYVANHVHMENPVYKEHPDWATKLYLKDGTKNLEKWDSHRLTTWFDTFLPTLDFSKKEVVEAMTDSAVYWVTKFDLDGFRHDATKHIQQDFWRSLTYKIKEQTQHPIYQIGETYGSPELIRSYVNTGMLDGQFNFNLYDASVAVFAKKEEPVKRLADALSESLRYYGNHHLMGNITGNQDRARFISYASGDIRFDEDAKKAGWKRNIQLTDSSAYSKLEMLHAFNLTTPGIPCIYYGDEYGMIGANDPDNRRMMRFDHYNKRETALKNKVKELIKLRKNSMALLYGSTQITLIDNTMIITRRYFDETIHIVFNKSDKTFKYQATDIEPYSYKIIK